MFDICPLFAITLYALTISAGEKLPDPSANERSFGKRFFENQKFTKYSLVLFRPISLRSFIDTIFTDFIRASLKDIGP